MANAFSISENDTLVSSSNIHSDKILRKIVTSTSEYAEYLKDFADFSFSGWSP